MTIDELNKIKDRNKKGNKTMKENKIMIGNIEVSFSPLINLSSKIFTFENNSVEYKLVLDKYHIQEFCDFIEDKYKNITTQICVHLRGISIHRTDGFIVSSFVGNLHVFYNDKNVSLLLTNYNDRTNYVTVNTHIETLYDEVKKFMNNETIEDDYCVEDENEETAEDECCIEDENEETTDNECIIDNVRNLSVLRNLLHINDFLYFETYDQFIKQSSLHIKTNDDHKILVIRYNNNQEFLNLFITHAGKDGFNNCLNACINASLKSSQFTDISVHYGTRIFKLVEK